MGSNGVTVLVDPSFSPDSQIDPTTRFVWQRLADANREYDNCVEYIEAMIEASKSEENDETDNDESLLLQSGQAEIEEDSELGDTEEESEEMESNTEDSEEEEDSEEGNNYSEQEDSEDEEEDPEDDNRQEDPIEELLQLFEFEEDRRYLRRAFSDMLERTDFEQRQLLRPRHTDPRFMSPEANKENISPNPPQEVHPGRQFLRPRRRGLDLMSDSEANNFSQTPERFLVQPPVPVDQTPPGFVVQLPLPVYQNPPRFAQHPDRPQNRKRKNCSSRDEESRGKRSRTIRL